MECLSNTGAAIVGSDALVAPPEIGTNGFNAAAVSLDETNGIFVFKKKCSLEIAERRGRRSLQTLSFFVLAISFCISYFKAVGNAPCVVPNENRLLCVAGG
jgi:hypothetical protein